MASQESSSTQPTSIYLHDYIPSQDVRERLEKLQTLYMSEITALNFTAHRTPELFEVLNILDSVIPFIGEPRLLKNAQKVLDIGTGGGYPGIPLAILLPDLQFTLTDSVGKKMDMIQRIITSSQLNNVVLSPGRCEELAHTSMRESYDVVVSRAVAKWTTLLEYALPFVKVGGYLYAYQGNAVLAEISTSAETITLLGGVYQETITYKLPSEYGERNVICIKKISHTADIYPRAVGVPKKTPLL